MDYIKTVSKHRLYSVGTADGYPEGTVLVFKERLFRRSYKLGTECASVGTIEEAETIARALFGGMRLEDLEVQIRDARRESEEREGSRGVPIKGDASYVE